MTKTRHNTALLVAVILTVIAIALHRFIPEKRFVATPNPAGAYYLYSTDLDDGQPAGIWLDEPQRKFRCRHPENPAPDYYCSFNQIHTPSPVKGIDFSQYKRINLLIAYSGPTPKLRFFMRNFNARYSSPNDSNSTKYNTLYIPEQNLNREISIQLSQFKVAEWWLIAYNIPIEDAQPDFENVINMGIDFSDVMSPGNHDVTVQRIELVGDWISREKWYLAILCAWLVGMGLYAINQLRLLREQNQQDLSLIRKLNKSNAHLQKETDKFRRLSTVDPLTQVYNRFGIDQIVGAISKADRASQEAMPDYSLILLDLDSFKQINDVRGHDAGDRVLKETAAVVENNLRHSDYLGRWGGEEFIIVLPGTDQESALMLAEKIRQAIAVHLYEPDDPLHITSSFGITERRDKEDFSSTFKRVDTALYTAKITGRNCCILAK